MEWCGWVYRQATVLAQKLEWFIRERRTTEKGNLFGPLATYAQFFSKFVSFLVLAHPQETSASCVNRAANPRAPFNITALPLSNGTSG
jgi:hypothetical protein